MGTDRMAADTTCARAIDLNPEKLRYVTEGSRVPGKGAQGRIGHLDERPGRFRWSLDLINP